MKTKLLALLVLIPMVFAIVGITSVFAEETAPAWTESGATVTESEDGFYNVSGIQYGTGAYTTEKVKLDGLTIQMKISDFKVADGGNQVAGVIFAGQPTASFDGGVAAMTLWYDPYGAGQTRFHVGANHDYNQATYAYTDPTGATAGFGLAQSLVLNCVSAGDIKIEIHSHDENAYRVKFTIAQPHLLWEANANYAVEDDGFSATFYMPKSVFASALDADGKLYVAAAGLQAPNLSIKVTESASSGEQPPVEPPVHEHVFVEGKCECGETDPNYVPEPQAPTIIGTADSDWSQSFNTPTIMNFAENGYTEISNLSGWGIRAHYNYLVKLDGLELSFRATTATRDCVGIILSNAQGSYFGESPIAITYWNNLYDGQARLNFAANHSYDSPSVVYSAPDFGASLGFGVASSMVCAQSDTMGWTIKFESYNDDFYSVKITMTDGQMWGNNANYNADELSCTVYLPKATVAGILNENGECYVTAAGFPQGANPAPAVEVKIADDNYRAYITGDVVTNAIAKVEAYVAAAGAITDAASYDAAMAARNEVLASANGLRARELAELGLIVAGVDADLAANEEIVAIVKKAVTDKLAAARAAYEALIADPTTLNDETLAAALALTNDAKAEYANRTSMLSEDAKAEIDAELAVLDYGHDYCIALHWVTTYQNKIAALNAGDPSIVNGLVEVKAYREAYETTTAYTKITTVLTEEHKSAMEAAIAAADAEVVNIETVVLPQLKESYIAAMEEKLQADLTIKPNLDDAKTAYGEIATYVTITEEDGELYTRYVAGYEALKVACEEFVSAQIAEVSELLTKEYTLLDEFKAVRNKFKSIKLDYLMEENAELAADLAELEAVISENVFYYMNATNIPVVEWNNSGLAVESKVEFPARLNYNKALNLKTGAEIVVELTSAAYYNDNTSANNLCFNFLAAPDSYKSMSDGISIIIWLYPTESNVQIMNYTDIPLANSPIATPLDGGTITISIKYEEYYSFVEDATYYAYVIRVNEAEIVLTPEVLTNGGHEVPDEVYFSMGSFADKKDYPNILTLVSANGVEFGMPSDEPECTEHVDADADGKCDNCGADVEIVEKPDDPKPEDPTDPDDDNQDEAKPSFFEKIALFFKNIFEAIKNFFAGLFGKK